MPVFDAIGQFLAEGRFLAVYLFLFAGAMMRGQSLYGLGRYSAYVAVNKLTPTRQWQKRAVEWLNADSTKSGTRAIQKWGLIVIPFSYLTVGFQSLVNAGAGLMRIPWWKYTLAEIPGALAWALIYSTIGFAVWSATIAAAAGSPLGFAGLAAAIILVVAWVMLLRRRRNAEKPAATLPLSQPTNN